MHSPQPQEEIRFLFASTPNLTYCYHLEWLQCLCGHPSKHQVTWFLYLLTYRALVIVSHHMPRNITLVLSSQSIPPLKITNSKISLSLTFCSSYFLTKPILLTSSRLLELCADSVFPVFPPVSVFMSFPQPEFDMWSLELCSHQHLDFSVPCY